MGLSARNEQGPPARRTSECTVAVILDGLDKSEAEALADMFANPAWTASAIARAYTEEYPDKWELSRNTAQRHRRGECKCARP